MKNKKVYITLFALICISIIILPKNTYAALQSNPNTHYKAHYNTNSAINVIRQMEAPNNVMGLLEEFNSDLTPVTSNNIDVHMMKNTEYGAIAILAVSGYGNPNVMHASEINSTTGNTTGVYYTSTSGTGYIEQVAATKDHHRWRNINNRYVDRYQYPVIPKVGDTLDMPWQSTSYRLGSTFMVYSYFLCRNSGGYFGCAEGNESLKYFIRGVAVCGEGF